MIRCELKRSISYMISIFAEFITSFIGWWIALIYYITHSVGVVPEEREGGGGDNDKAVVELDQTM